MVLLTVLVVPVHVQYELKDIESRDRPLGPLVKERVARTS